MSHVVYVASTNPVKLDAVKNAFKSKKIEVHVIGISVPSGVPNQPVNGQTALGAQNRLRNLIERVGQQNTGQAPFAYVSIESGMFYDDTTLLLYGTPLMRNSKVVDRCHVCLHIPRINQTIELTSRLYMPCPARYLIASMMYTNGRKTAGEFIEQYRGYEPGTWYTRMHRNPGRLAQITNTVEDCIGDRHSIYDIYAIYQHMWKTDQNNVDDENQEYTYNIRVNLNPKPILNLK